MDEWEKCLVVPDRTIRQAMEQLGKSRQQAILVVDGDRRLLGTVTEGDFRRAVLAGISIDQPIVSIMNGHPITTTPGTDLRARIAVMRRHSIRHLPVVDGQGRVVGLVRPEAIIKSNAPKHDNWVVIMAGGQGQRLRPLTADTPKPLLPVGGRPLLETIVRGLSDHGLTRIYMSINYRGEQIKTHFGDGERFGVEIRYIEEQRSMGTAGALGLIQETHGDPLLVVNGDVLTKINYGSLLAYHEEHEADAAIGLREFETQIPFGVVTSDGDRVLDIVEKPIQRVMVNAGIYVIEPKVVARVPKDDPIDMTDVLRDLVAAGGKVVGYAIHDYWLDVGRIEDLDRAAAEFGVHFR